MTTKLRREGAPPVAPRRTDYPLFRRTVLSNTEFPHTEHGEVLDDPLAWLRERDDPAVLEHLRAENAFTDAAMAASEALQDALYEQMVARIEEDDSSVPVRLGDFWYYQRERAGKQHALCCRKAARPGAPPDASYDSGAAEEVLLDLDELREAEELPYLRLGGYAPSSCGQLLAYSVDVAGHERFQVRVVDLATGEYLPDRLENASRSLAWGTVDGRSELLFYVTRDDAQRPHKVLRHRLGTDPEDDDLLWHEEDDRFFVGLRRSRSGRYLFVSAGSHTTTEIRLLDAHDPEAQIRPLTGRRPGVEFDVDHHPGDTEAGAAGAGASGRFFLLTNLDALEFRLVEVPDDESLREPSPESWREVVPYDPEVHLEQVVALRDHLVLLRRVDGLPSVRVFDLTSEVLAYEDVTFDDAAHDVRLGSHPELDNRLLRIEYENPVQPATVYDIELGTGEPILGERRRRKIETVHHYDPSLYEARRLTAEAPDGETVPVDVVLRRDRAKSLDDDERRPLLLYAYGSYGHSLEAKFYRNIVNLLDRGWAFAVAHVRGGGERGKWWHEAGRMEHAENTFHDFVACAERLIGEGLTTPRGLAIRGGSAGGLLVGATLNLRPDLFHAAIADVPFVDALQTMLDPSLPLTIIEYEEWGNPSDDVEAFRRIRGYSPIENVRNASYPHVLATGGLHDPRVQYWEPTKWVQVLRERTSGGLKLLHTHMEAGHGGSSGRYEHLREEARRQAFLLASMATERTPDRETGDMPQSAHG